MICHQVPSPLNFLAERDDAEGALPHYLEGAGAKFEAVEALV